MNRRQIFAVAVLVTALVMGTWAVGRVQESSDNTYANIERFIQVLTKVRDHYVEPVTTDKLMDNAIRGMLRTLDPYSQYLDKEEAERLETTTHGAFGGIGISIGMRDGWVTVISPIEGTPAWRAGMQGGDRIIKIDGVSTEGYSLDDAMKRMRGEKGTKVVLTVYREGRDRPIDFEITRDIIQIKSVPFAGVLENGVGYIRLSTFSERSREESSGSASPPAARSSARSSLSSSRRGPGRRGRSSIAFASRGSRRGPPSATP
jgi:carboxyl-terminal processing protease